MAYIFESPDGGETIYRRDTNNQSRVVYHTKDPAKQRRQDRWILWQDILRAAENDEVIEDMLSRVEVVYWLGKNDND